MLISTHMQLNTGIAPSKRANHSQIRRDTMMLVPEEGQHHEKLILKKNISFSCNALWKDTHSSNGAQWITTRKFTFSEQ